MTSHTNVIGSAPERPVFRAGDEAVLTDGTYQGTHGVFLRLRPDVNWAEIRESNGNVRSHPVAWLANYTKSEGK